MAAAVSSPLTTHVLNTGDGIPASKMAVTLHQLDSELKIWNMLGVGNIRAATSSASLDKLVPLRTTNEDGRCSGLISQEAFTTGMYKLRFETGSYWESRGHASFFPYVEVVFTITDPGQRFHLPLLMSRFSYSTYRGS